MASINQTIIIRTDIFSLPDDLGLISAQVGHLHFEGTRAALNDGADFESFPEEYKEWIKEPYLLVKRIPNREALTHYHDLAIKNGLPVYEWADTVYVRLSPTQKLAFPDTVVGIAIGPTDADKIRTVVGDLPLL